MKNLNTVEILQNFANRPCVYSDENASCLQMQAVNYVRDWLPMQYMGTG